MRIRNDMDTQAEYLRKARDRYAAKLAESARFRPPPGMAGEAGEIAADIMATGDLVRRGRAAVREHPWAALACTAALFLFLGKSQMER